MKSGDRGIKAHPITEDRLRVGERHFFDPAMRRNPGSTLQWGSPKKIQMFTCDGIKRRKAEVAKPGQRRWT